jgi:protein-S-isoprenylcysteine O-methyltransferase Ste14
MNFYHPGLFETGYHCSFCLYSSGKWNNRLNTKKYKIMETTDHPGVYFPPPLIFLIIFFLGVLLQKLIPLNPAILRFPVLHIIGWVLAVGSFGIGVPAVVKFYRTNNTLVTIRPATSLQTKGIYSLTRNPMYLGATIFYCGIGIIIGYWWTLILLPLVVLIISVFVIRLEERYLQRAFGQSYLDYKKNVRRWI